MLTVKQVYDNLTMRDLIILDSINSKNLKTVYAVIDNVEMPQTTVYRCIKRMIKLGIIKRKETNRDTTITPQYRIRLHISKV